MKKRLLVHFVSLGCPKNLVDSERLLGAAANLGLIPTGELALADLIVINTCAFIGAATKEAVFEVLRAVSEKKKSAKVAVVGCLAARYSEELSLGIPELSLVLAPGGYEGFSDKIASLLGLKAPVMTGHFETWKRVPGTPPWRAWLKIAEGCDHKCAYCLIPALRGPLRTRPIEELVAEAESLAKSGVKELTLVAQDATSWRDRGLDLADLAEALGGVEDLAWLRIMYAYPERLTLKMIARLAKVPKLVPYIDVPIQHASPAVLRRMGRKASDPLALVRRLRDLWPKVAVRTTLMVGFPGETDEDFGSLVRLVEEGAFDHAGVFKFSPEDGVRAASMPGQIPPVIKDRRYKRLMSRQRKVSLNLNRARVGDETLVLVEGPSDDSDLVMVGRGPFQAPEVDGLIYFDGHQPEAGSMVKARLIKAGPYDLAATLVGGELPS